MLISSVPPVLVIHLKRFSFGNHFGKIKHPVQFGAEMYVSVQPQSKSSSSGSNNGSNGSSRSEMRVKYELYGVIVHHGSSTHSGHYIAYVKVQCRLLRIALYDTTAAAAVFFSYSCT